MNVSVTETVKPISQLAAKTHPEIPAINMEAPSLPEFYKGQVCKNLCIIATARPSEKTKSGIILTTKTTEAVDYAAQIGRLEAVGPFFYSKKRFGDVEAPQVGDFVMFTPYVGRRLDIGDDKFLIIEDTDILIKKLDPSHDFKLFT